MLDYLFIWTNWSFNSKLKGLYFLYLDDIFKKIFNFKNVINLDDLTHTDIILVVFLSLEYI